MTDSQKFDLILEKMSSIDGKIDTLIADVSALNDKASVFESDMIDVKLEITGIHLTLENEIRVNIIRVAEGHLDLSRKLDDYIKLSNEIKDKQEITDIYIKMHDNKLRALA